MAGTKILDSVHASTRHKPNEDCRGNHLRYAQSRIFNYRSPSALYQSHSKEGQQLITAEIAGYSFNTENKCPECIAAWSRLALMDEGYWKTTGKTTEELLSLLAGLWGVDRDYVDSNDFPVPFSGHTAKSEADRAVLEGSSPETCQCGNDFTGEF
jgi:hypothetical protein